LVSMGILCDVGGQMSDLRCQILDVSAVLENEGEQNESPESSVACGMA
jgi:hypothetical protein